jgi:hypothetical protein
LIENKKTKVATLNWIHLILTRKCIGVEFQF